MTIVVHTRVDLNVYPHLQPQHPALDGLISAPNFVSFLKNLSLLFATTYGQAVLEKSPENLGLLSEIGNRIHTVGTSDASVEEQVLLLGSLTMVGKKTLNDTIPFFPVFENYEQKRQSRVKLGNVHVDLEELYFSSFVNEENKEAFLASDFEHIAQVTREKGEEAQAIYGSMQEHQDKHIDYLQPLIALLANRATLALDQASAERQSPGEIQPRSSITLGDGHGNPLKLLHALLSHNIIKMSKEDFESYRDTYKALIAMDNAIINAQARETQARLKIADFEQSIKTLESELEYINKGCAVDSDDNKSENSIEDEFTSRNSLNDQAREIKRNIQFKQEEMDSLSSTMNHFKNTVEGLNRELAAQSISLISQLKNTLSSVERGKPDTSIRFIGDILGDRGQNDLAIIDLLEILSDLDIPFQIMLSNHDALFNNYVSNGYRRLGSPENEKLKRTCNIDLQGRSLINFDKVFHTMSTPEKIKTRDSIKKNYTPKILLIDYEINTVNNGITLFTHAPVSYELIAQLYSHYATNGLVQEPFLDANVHELTASIDRLNRAFQNQLLVSKDFPHNHTLFAKSLFGKFVWVRVQKGSTSPALQKSYPINFVHGHNNTSHYEGSIPLNSSLGNQDYEFLGEEQVCISIPYKMSFDLCVETKSEITEKASISTKPHLMESISEEGEVEQEQIPASTVQQKDTIGHTRGSSNIENSRPVRESLYRKTRGVDVLPTIKEVEEDIPSDSSCHASPKMAPRSPLLTSTQDNQGKPLVLQMSLANQASLEPTKEAEWTLVRRKARKI